MGKYNNHCCYQHGNGSYRSYSLLHYRYLLFRIIQLASSVDRSFRLVVVHFCQYDDCDIVLISGTHAQHFIDQRFAGTLYILLCNHRHIFQYDLFDTILTDGLYAVTCQDENIVISGSQRSGNIYLRYIVAGYRAGQHMALAAC